MKTTQELLRERDLLEAIIRSSAVATFVLDADHKVMYWNEACEELTGVKARSVIGTDEHWKAFYDHRRPCVADIALYGISEDFSKLYKTRSKSLLSKEGLHAEDWFAGLNGKDRYVIFDAAPIYGPDGEIIAAVETLQDITEIKRNEEAADYRWRSMTAAFRSLPAPAAIVSVKDKTYYEVNRSWEKATGYSREEYVGNSVHRPELWNDAKEIDRLIDKALSMGGFRDQSTWITTKGGELISWLISAEPLEYGGSPCIILSAHAIGKK